MSSSFSSADVRLYSLDEFKNIVSQDRTLFYDAGSLYFCEGKKLVKERSASFSLADLQQIFLGKTTKVFRLLTASGLKNHDIPHEHCFTLISGTEQQCVEVVAPEGSSVGFAAEQRRNIISFVGQVLGEKDLKLVMDDPLNDGNYIYSVEKGRAEVVVAREFKNAEAHAAYLSKTSGFEKLTEGLPVWVYMYDMLERPKRKKGRLYFQLESPEDGKPVEHSGCEEGGALLWSVYTSKNKKCALSRVKEDNIMTIKEIETMYLGTKNSMFQSEVAEGVKKELCLTIVGKHTSLFVEVAQPESSSEEQKEETGTGLHTALALATVVEHLMSAINLKLSPPLLSSVGQEFSTHTAVSSLSQQSKSCSETNIVRKSDSEEGGCGGVRYMGSSEFMMRSAPRSGGG